MLTSMLINYEKLKFLRYASKKIPIVKFTENLVNLALLKTLLKLKSVSWGSYHLRGGNDISCDYLH